MGFIDKMKEMKTKAVEMKERAKASLNSPNGREERRYAQTYQTQVGWQPRASANAIDHDAGFPRGNEAVSVANEASFSSSGVAENSPVVSLNAAFERVELNVAESKTSATTPLAVIERGDSMQSREQTSDAGGVESSDRGSLIDGMERGYFEEPSTSDQTFDPVLVSLRKLRESFTVEDLSKEEERLSELVERVSSALNKEILAHADDFEEGMKNMTEVYDKLESSSVVLSNAQRLLKRIGGDVSSALHVQESYTTKDSIVGALRILEEIKFCQTCETKIRSHLDVSEYAEAMALYSKAWEMLENMHVITCVSTLREDFVALRWELVTCVDNALVDLCGTFDEAKFSKLYTTYPKLGPEVKHLGDKIQDAFLKAVEMQTEGMLRLHAMLSRNQDESVTKRKSRMGYKELCSQLSSVQFVPCLRKTLESLYEIFLSSHKMTAWCKAAMENELNQADNSAINTCSSLIAALEINRKPIVEMASVRLAALLQASSAPSNAAFREVFDLCRVFITCAEAFCGEEAPVLRTQLERIGDRYFESLHSARLDATRTMLENERWVPVSVDAVKRVRDDLRNAMQRGRAANGIGKSLGESAISAFTMEQILNAKSFDKFVDEPNPFAETDSEESNREPMSPQNGPNLETSGTNEDTKETKVNPFEAEGETGSVGDRTGLDRHGVKITASSLYILQGIVEYTALMQVMRPSVPIIFNGICQLFELALVKTFTAFGRTEALLPDSRDMTPRLRGTLSRLGNSGGVMAIRLRANGETKSDVLSSANMYGLKERGIALESLSRVADEFNRIKTRVKRSLPLKDAALADRFYSHTVAAVDDLREHVYKSVASQLLKISFCAEAIGDGDPNFALVNSTFAGKYNIRESPSRHNKWVDDVQAELLQFTTKLTCADITLEALKVLWQHAASVIQDVIVDGFSKVKKCTDQGRALMKLDVDVLRKEFAKLAPEGALTEWRYLQTYIDAFYVPENEAEKWMMIHPEFTKQQKLALVAQSAFAHRWATKFRNDLIRAIETDQLFA